ncbi:uncharacterized protein [Linepithema humile]|uniref:uncharacterized protein n=1 Tax=Linepithema humile TaxID=83485 RepID=UPI00351EF2CF
MRHEAQMHIVKKKRRVRISKNLSIIHSWNIIGPIVAQEIGAADYTPIPYCFDTNAYQIGHIFVPVDTQITCFRAVPVLKMLGPIRDFVVKAETNFKWLDKGFHSVRTPGDHVDFRVILQRGKNKISFTGHNCCFLSKAHDMVVPGNVTINRTAHENLFNTKWIGLITNVVITKVFEFHIVKDLRERTVYIGDNEHTILFKYEICKIDENGTVVNSEMKKIRCKWLPIGDKESDKLPLNEFPSTRNK